MCHRWVTMLTVGGLFVHYTAGRHVEPKEHHVRIVALEQLENGEKTLNELAVGLNPDHLRGLTNEMIDGILALIQGQDDRVVTHVPQDPDAYDPVAERPEEVGMAWTLGHVIVHTTASAEETAALAAELARGVNERRGRSRSEVPWTQMTTLSHCVARLEESRRMRLASLDMWPDDPYLENRRELWNGEMVNAVGQFLSGLWHEHSHLNQITEIIRQASESGHHHSREKNKRTVI
ncbi:MAG: DinB family protein [Candidatus Promineifilaceae bacterium]|nr:DinB family protein [Candidatus Promineifilaceae bacterium]